MTGEDDRAGGGLLARRRRHGRLLRPERPVQRRHRGLIHHLRRLHRRRCACRRRCRLFEPLPICAQTDGGLILPLLTLQGGDLLGAQSPAMPFRQQGHLLGKRRHGLVNHNVLILLIPIMLILRTPGRKAQAFFVRPERVRQPSHADRRTPAGRRGRERREDARHRLHGAANGRTIRSGQ